MKKLTRLLTSTILITAFCAAPATLVAAEKKSAKPYPLTTCLVSGEKLGGMGDPYVFVHEGQEIKLCCKGCLKDFKKDPSKFVKKLADAQKEKK